jgi:hypothetical protein
MSEGDRDELRRTLHELAAHYGGGRTIDALRDGYTEIFEEMLEGAQDEIGRNGTVSALHSAMVRAGLDEGTP